MTIWQAGQRLTPQRLNDTTPDETTTSGLVAATNWSIVSFVGRRRRGTTYINALITKTGGTLAADTGTENVLGDPLIATLPAGWWPPEDQGVAWDNGVVNGQGLIESADGEVRLRTISYNQAIANSTNVRVSAMWIG